MPCKIGDEYFDCQLEIADRDCINPGEQGEVQVSFASIGLVSPLIQIGSRYEVYSAPQPIGELFITVDPWASIEETIVQGEIKQAVIRHVDWTASSIIIDGGITTFLRSQDVGLQAWEEIRQVLSKDDSVAVRIESVNRVSREINVSLVRQGLERNLDEFQC